MALLVGVNDPLATLADNIDLRRKLDKEALIFFKSYDADHISLILGSDPQLLNNDLLGLLKNGSKTQKPESKEEISPDKAKKSEKA